MSKQSEAKQVQGYEQRPVIPVCKNCRHYQSEFQNYESFTYGVLLIEKELRCGIGCFAVKKMATCKLYERKD